MTIEFSVEHRLSELREQAKVYAKAKADMEYLNHFRKAKLAMLMASFATDTDAAGNPLYPTAAAQEREARRHPEYLQVLQGLRQATEIAEREGWLLRIAMKGADLYQTTQATKRAEMKHLSGTP